MAKNYTLFPVHHPAPQCRIAITSLRRPLSLEVCARDIRSKTTEFLRAAWVGAGKILCLDLVAFIGGTCDPEALAYSCTFAQCALLPYSCTVVHFVQGPFIPYDFCPIIDFKQLVSDFLQDALSKKMR